MRVGIEHRESARLGQMDGILAAAKDFGAKIGPRMLSTLAKACGTRGLGHNR